MFGKLFGETGPHLNPLKMDHLRQVVALIAETDEDDAEEAEHSLREKRGVGMFVLLDQGKVIGVTGATAADGADDIVWLSWTYLAEDRQGQGMGRFMIEDLLRKLNETGMRKLFISTSDYREDGEEIYADAHRFYEAMGASVELRIPDYHDRGETKIVFGLTNPGVTPQSQERPDRPNGVHFGVPAPAPESEGGGALNWEVGGDGITGIEEALKVAREHSARIVFSALPEDISELAEPELSRHGFTRLGALKDYYDVGFDQIWWSTPLDPQ